MIEGIKLDFTSDDLKKHLSDRHDFHQKKADWYGSQIDSLQSGDVGENPNASNDPVTSLRRSLQDHQQKAALFAIIGEHVVPAETYRLTHSDLATLEIISRYY